MIWPSGGEIMACIAPSAQTSAETPKAARSAPKRSTGMVYKFVLQAAIQKKLNDIPAVASAGVGSIGMTIVSSRKQALIRHTRFRASTGGNPLLTRRHDSHPPSNAPRYPQILTIDE